LLKFQKCLSNNRVAQKGIKVATRGYPGLTTCGGIFRGSMGEFIGVFSAFLEVHTALVVEFYGVIHAMEEAQKMGLTNVWLECDFALVCAAFTARTNVPWMFRNRWNACLNYCEKIRFMVIHIFREVNACADKLANFGIIASTLSVLRILY